MAYSCFDKENVGQCFNQILSVFVNRIFGFLRCGSIITKEDVLPIH